MFRAGKSRTCWSRSCYSARVCARAQASEPAPNPPPGSAQPAAPVASPGAATIAAPSAAEPRRLRSIRPTSPERRQGCRRRHRGRHRRVATRTRSRRGRAPRPAPALSAAQFPARRAAAGTIQRRGSLDPSQVPAVDRQGANGLLGPGPAHGQPPEPDQIARIAPGSAITSACSPPDRSRPTPPSCASTSSLTASRRAAGRIFHCTCSSRFPACTRPKPGRS